MSFRLFTLIVVIATFGALPATAGERRGQTDQVTNDHPVPRGTHITITNPSGRISVRGTDATSVHVTGRFEDSGNSASVRIDAPRSAGAWEIEPSSEGRDEEGGEVALDVELPRYAILDSVSSGSGDIVVAGMDGDTKVDCSSGNVRVADVGGVIVNAGSGDVVVEKVRGAAFVEVSSGNLTVRGVGGDLRFRAGSGDARVDTIGAGVDATMQSGDLTINDARGVVRIQSISGEVTVNRAGSGVRIASASGNIALENITGDVDAKTASGNVVFTGEISVGHDYRLKSMSGEAIMRLCGSIPGFTVTMRSYSGEIETEFELKLSGPMQISKELTGRYEDGSVQIQLEAFSGSAKLLKCQTSVDGDE